MSLLEEAMEKFTVINKVTVNDGYGGVVTEWIDGASITGAIVFDSSAERAIAEEMTSYGAYTLTVRKNILLDYHDVLRRESTGQIFRLTSNSDDKRTPDSAGLNMRQYSAELWELTSS